MIEINTILLLALCFFALLNLVLIILLLARKNNKNNTNNEAIQNSILHDEFSRTRTEINTTFSNFSRVFNGQQEAVRGSVEKKLSELQNGVEKKLGDMEIKVEKKLGDMQSGLEKNLTRLQTDNAEKLEKMRETVDEKLHKTLETRLGESFKIVSLQLEKVQQGLGEMQTIATGVGDLKKVLSNVKTKGVLGEMQLSAILEQILTPNQYAQNVKTKQNSNDLVEFAIKIPSKTTVGSTLWLPIDAKFPTEDYQRLEIAYEKGDSISLEAAKKELERKIKKFANDIHTKYIDPPKTTDFGIMFLPFEGLYAEVLRIPGLFETIQRDYKVTITGPTTIAAFLNSLQMGFRTLAVEKRTSEIWSLLSVLEQSL